MHMNKIDIERIDQRSGFWDWIFGGTVGGT